MAHFEAVTPDAVEFTGERFTPEAGNASDQRTGLRGKPRRTWPQRFLMLAGLLVSVVCFGAAFVFWQANIVLNDIPRISVGPDVLAQGGGPGEPVNILLLGVDSSEGLDEDDPVRSGRETEDEARGIVRPDTILIARLDPATGTGSVLSLPRDLIVNVEGGTSTRLNATQVIGGIGGLITAIDETLSIPVNHFVQVDFAGFSDIVDIVGGVPVHFPFPTRDLGSGLSIPQSGCINLNGSQALSYVRARSIEELIDDEWQDLPAPVPDLARIARQQEFLVLTTEEILDVGRADVSRITSFIDAGTQAVQLDAELTPGEIADLASAFSDFDTDALDISPCRSARRSRRPVPISARNFAPNKAETYSHDSKVLTMAFGHRMSRSRSPRARTAMSRNSASEDSLRRALVSKTLRPARSISIRPTATRRFSLLDISRRCHVWLLKPGRRYVSKSGLISRAYGCFRGRLPTCRELSHKRLQRRFLQRRRPSRHPLRRPRLRRLPRPTTPRPLRLLSQLLRLKTKWTYSRHLKPKKQLIRRWKKLRAPSARPCEVVPLKESAAQLSADDQKETWRWL